MNAIGIDDRNRPRRIYNPVQADAATFLETSDETGGARTLIELEVAPGGKVTPHYHLTYSERFKLIEGRLTVEIDGVRHELEPGDEAVVAPGSLHAWRNPGAERSIAHVELRPGSPGFENALRVAYGLAADGLVRGTASRAIRSTRRWCSRWESCACPAPTPRFNESWGCWPASAGGAVSTASSSGATSDRPSRATPVRLRPRRAGGQLSARRPFAVLPQVLRPGGGHRDERDVRHASSTSA